MLRIPYIADIDYRYHEWYNHPHYIKQSW